MKKVKIYDTKEFNTIKEMLENSGEEFGERTAFVIKHKDGKNISYENISYERFLRDINSLGTEMLNMGYKDKKIAIIGKNRYEWVVAFAAILGGVGTCVPLDKGLPDEEIEMSLKKSKAEVIFCEETYLESVKNIMLKGETSLNKVICMDKVDKMESIKELIRKR